MLPKLRKTRNAALLTAVGSLLLLEHRLHHGGWWDRKPVCHGKLGALLLLCGITANHSTLALLRCKR